jgi:hypothetical protein
LSTEGVHATAALAQLFDVLGESVVHWPAGKQADAVTIQAIVDRSEQTPLQARLEGPAGRKNVRFATLLLYRSVTVTESQDQLKASIFVFDSQKWFAVTVNSADDGGQEVSVESVTAGQGYTKAGR